MRDVHCVTSPPRLRCRPSAVGRYRLELRPHISVVQCHGSMSAEIYRVTVVVLNILSADQHGAVGLDLSSVQLLGSPELYKLPMRIKYSS